MYVFVDKIHGERLSTVQFCGVLLFVRGWRRCKELFVVRPIMLICPGDKCAAIGVATSLIHDIADGFIGANARYFSSSVDLSGPSLLLLY